LFTSVLLVNSRTFENTMLPALFANRLSLTRSTALAIDTAAVFPPKPPLPVTTSPISSPTRGSLACAKFTNPRALLRNTTRSIRASVAWL
jgi:hypothetical protein